jgi:rubredoxin
MNYEHAGLEMLDATIQCPKCGAYAEVKTPHGIECRQCGHTKQEVYFVREEPRVGIEKARRLPKRRAKE